MTAYRQTIGFDRDIRLAWLDAVAARAASGDDPKIARTWLDKYLADSVGGSGHGGNRDKTITVLCRVWITPPIVCRRLRDLAIELLSDIGCDERLALHWGMTIACYPFFGDVMDAVGRLLAIQGDVQRRDAIRRMVESWGERPAVSRATRAAWQSAINWGVLIDSKERGRYTMAKPLRLSRRVESFLVEAALHWSQFRPLSLSALIALPCMFPFDLSRAAMTVRSSNRVFVSREGADLEFVRVK